MVCALVTGVQTCALPIYVWRAPDEPPDPGEDQAATCRGIAVRQAPPRRRGRCHRQGRPARVPAHARGPQEAAQEGWWHEGRDEQGQVTGRVGRQGFRLATSPYPATRRPDRKNGVAEKRV